MKSALYALLFVLALPPASSAQADAEWGKVDREELFSTHFPEAPHAGAVILLDHAIARVDSKDHLKYYRHHRTKIFSKSAYDRGVVRIPYGKDEEIKKFRAQTIIPPGNVVEVDKNHRHEEKLPDGSKVLVVEFPSLQPGVVLEYEYELRSDDLYKLPVWPFRRGDFTRLSRFELMIPKGMSYDASFSWVPGMVPRPQIRMINDPEDPSRELEDVAWELRNQPAVAAVPMAGDPERYEMALYVQLEKYTSTYKNFTVCRSWGGVGDQVAAQDAAFAKDDAGVSEWVKAASLAGDARSIAVGLHRLVRDGIAVDPDGPDVATSTMREVVAKRAATPRAKNVLLAYLMRKQGIPADVVLIRCVDHGPAQTKYVDAGQFDRAVVRAQIGGETVWTDASFAGFPFGLLPPCSQAGSGLKIAPNGASELVDIPAPAVESGRKYATDATFDKNGTLLGTTTIELTGWDALEPRKELAHEGGRTYVASLLRARFGGAAVLDSFRVAPLEDATQPLTVKMDFRVADYAHRSGETVRLQVPYLTSLQQNPLPAGERELPVILGHPGTTEETVALRLPEGWKLPALPARGSARTSDIRYKVAHVVDEGTLRSTRTVRLSEAVVSRDAADQLRGVFDRMVATDASEVTLERQALRASSSR